MCKSLDIKVLQDCKDFQVYTLIKIMSVTRGGKISEILIKINYVYDWLLNIMQINNIQE